MRTTGQLSITYLRCWGLWTIYYDEEKADRLEERVKGGLSLEPYCDVEDEEACIRGWETGKRVARM